MKLELQADFLAGVWVYHAQRMNIIKLEPGDLESAISATTAVGMIQFKNVQWDILYPIHLRMELLLNVLIGSDWVWRPVI